MYVVYIFSINKIMKLLNSFVYLRFCVILLIINIFFGKELSELFLEII